MTNFYNKEFLLTPRWYGKSFLRKMEILDFIGDTDIRDLRFKEDNSSTVKKINITIPSGDMMLCFGIELEFILFALYERMDEKEIYVLLLENFYPIITRQYLRNLRDDKEYWKKYVAAWDTFQKFMGANNMEFPNSYLRDPVSFKESENNNGQESTGTT